MSKPRISAIAAIGRKRELGLGNRLLWQIPDDLKRFRAITSGKPVIMGRKTFESILQYLGKPLPNRLNIVVTRNTDFANPHDGVVIARSIDDAIQQASAGGPAEICIIGGASIYESALPHTDKLYLTIVDDEKEADAFFPSYESEFTKKVFEEDREWNGLRYKWIDLER